MREIHLVVPLALAAVVLVPGGLFLSGCAGFSNSTQQLEVFTEPFAVGTEGSPPPVQMKLRFPSFDPPRLMWVTGFSGEMIHQDGSAAAAGTAYRTDLGFEFIRHARIHELPVYHTDHLFTLTERQNKLVFPEGFGLPFYSDERFTLSTKLLGPSPSVKAAGVRQRIILEYILDQDLDVPMKPLFATSGLWVQSSDGGRDRILRLPYDTRTHYITAPLRALAQSVELRDLSTGETVYDSVRETGEETAGERRQGFYSDANGIEMFQDRSYLLVDNYDGSAAEETDSGAAMLLYLRDKLFKKLPRQRAKVVHFEEPLEFAHERLLLSTNHGKFEIAFYPEVAPKHYKQILDLARLGVYDGVQFHRVEPGFLVQLGYPEERMGPPPTAEQRAALRPLEAEFSDLPMNRWTVAMALRDNTDPDSAVASFFILLDEAPHLEQQYTIIGRVFTGLTTLQEIAELPLRDSTPIEPAFIEKAEVEFYEKSNSRLPSRPKRSGASRDE